MRRPEDFNVAHALRTRTAAVRIAARALANDVPLFIAAAICAFFLSACGGGSGSDSQPRGDPLAPYEWHLQNTGQSAFSARGGTPGIDLRATEVFNSGETGDGVRVLVLDDGLDIRHPDLQAQIAADMLHNFDSSATNATDPTPPGDAFHGTGVGGTIGATANNGIGVRGVAPGVKLGGARYLCDQGCVSPINTLDAFGGAPFSRIADVINASFGINAIAPVEFDPDSNFLGVALQRLATLREGRGILLVKAGGNEYLADPGTEGADCSSAQAAHVSCANTNLDPGHAMPQQIVVGAVNADGVKSSYSNAGSSLLVAGLGGEFGISSTNPRIDKRITGPAIVTTDLAGCDRGASKTAGGVTYNDLNNPTSQAGQSLNANCDYMATMNGTSVATPTVAGVVALVLHANPELTWRDVRTILMKTARRIDPNRVPNTVTLPSGESYVPEPAWTRNAAGFWFDNWYGFGLVDAAAAVATARSYTAYLKGPMRAGSPLLPSGDGCQTQETPDCGTEIPVGTASGLEIPIDNTDSSISTIEAVQLTLFLGAANMRDLAIELISPGGTRSVLLNAYSELINSGSDVRNFFLGSYAFNGEPGQGTWKLRLIDVGERQSPTPAKFQGAQIQILGH